ncbi:MAG: hypothetical protein Q9174_006881, partial [Haloplaca sp. 1 TL-2023]
MQFSVTSLILRLFGFASAFAGRAPQIIFQQATSIDEPKYGYSGPGTYRITSYSNNYA